MIGSMNKLQTSRLKSLTLLIDNMTKYNHSLVDIKWMDRQNGIINLQVKRKIINIQQNMGTLYTQDYLFYEKDLEQTSVKEIKPFWVGSMQIEDKKSILFDKEDQNQKNRVVVTKKEDKTVLYFYQKVEEIYVLMAQKEVTDIHGQILQNCMVGDALQFNRAGDKVIYVAEPKQQKRKGFFSGEDKPWEEKCQEGMERMLYEGDLGEQLDGVKGGKMFIFERTGEVKEVMVKERVFPMNAQLVEWGDKEAVLFSGVDLEEGVQIGILHCLNRPTQIYLLREESLVLRTTGIKETPLEWSNLKDGKVSEQESNWKPIMDSEQKQLGYLSGPVGIGHTNYYQLETIDLDALRGGETKRQVVLEQYQQQKGDFAGIAGFFDMVQSMHYGRDGGILVNSYFGISRRVHRIDTVSGEVVQLSHPIEKDGQMDEWHLMNTSSAQPLLKHSTYRCHGETIFYGKVPLLLSPPKREPVLESVEQINLKMLEGVEGVLLQPKGEDLPLVVIAHGGPHANVVTSRGSVKLLLMRGFAVLLVNFSGSLGYGQQGVDALLGNIGSKDGKEFEWFIEEAHNKGRLDKKRVAILGGSYGGYLATRLPQLFPNRYKCSVILNPVTDFVFNKSITDIPEWNHAESLGVKKDDSVPLSIEELSQMARHSPVYHPIAIIPQLLLLGQKDRRVPYQQGLYYYQLAKSQKVPVECYVYPESNHGLGECEDTSYDVLVKTILFLETHL